MTPECLVIGASGLIGSALLERLGEKAIGTYSGSQDSHLYFFDLRKSSLSDFLDRCPSIRVVYLVGAITEIDRCATCPGATRAINVHGAKRVIADALERKLKVVFCSSDAVFNGFSGSYLDDAPLSPIIEYGRQKAEIENFLRSQAGEWVIARLSKVLAYSGNSIFQSWLTCISGKVQILCATDQIFTPADMDDVVASLEFLGWSQYVGAFNVGGPLAVSRYDLAVEFLGEITANAQIAPCKLSDVKFLEQRPLNTSLNSRKLYALFSREFISFADCCLRARQQLQIPSMQRGR